MIKLLPLLISAILVARTLVAAEDTSSDTDSHSRCELLNTSLTYSQENAPRDISGVVS